MQGTGSVGLFRNASYVNLSTNYLSISPNPSAATESLHNDNDNAIQIYDRQRRSISYRALSAVRNSGAQQTNNGYSVPQRRTLATDDAEEYPEREDLEYVADEDLLTNVAMAETQLDTIDQTRSSRFAKPRVKLQPKQQTPYLGSAFEYSESEDNSRSSQKGRTPKFAFKGGSNDPDANTYVDDALVDSSKPYYLKDSRPSERQNFSEVFSYFSRKYELADKIIVHHLQPNNLQPFGTGANMVFPSALKRRQTTLPSIESEESEAQVIPIQGSSSKTNQEREYSTATESHKCLKAQPCSKLNIKNETKKHDYTSSLKQRIIPRFEFRPFIYNEKELNRFKKAEKIVPRVQMNLATAGNKSSLDLNKFQSAKNYQKHLPSYTGAFSDFKFPRSEGRKRKRIYHMTPYKTYKHPLGRTESPLSVLSGKSKTQIRNSHESKSAALKNIAGTSSSTTNIQSLLDVKVTRSEPAISASVPYFDKSKDNNKNFSLKVLHKPVAAKTVNPAKIHHLKYTKRGNKKFGRTDSQYSVLPSNVNTQFRGVHEGKNSPDIKNPISVDLSEKQPPTERKKFSFGTVNPILPEVIATPIVLRVTPKSSLLQTNIFPESGQLADNIKIGKNEKFVAPWPSYSERFQQQKQTDKPAAAAKAVPAAETNENENRQPNLDISNRYLHSTPNPKPRNGKGNGIRRSRSMPAVFPRLQKPTPFFKFSKNYYSTKKGMFCPDGRVSDKPNQPLAKDYDCPCIEPFQPSYAPPLRRPEKRNKPKEKPKICPQGPTCPPRADAKLKIKRKPLPVIVPATGCPCVEVKIKRGCPLQRLKKRSVKPSPRICPIPEPCPPRADECMEFKKKCLPKLSVGSCPCPELPAPTDVEPLKQLNLKLVSLPRECPKPPRCPPRADECEWDRLYAKRSLPKFKPSNCPCIEPEPLQDFKLSRLKKFKPKDPPPCPTKRVCDPNDRADKIYGYRIKEKKLPPLQIDDCLCIEPYIPPFSPPLKRLEKRNKPKEPPKICPRGPTCPPRADSKLKLKRKPLPKIIPPTNCPCVEIKIKRGCPLPRLKKRLVKPPPRICPVPEPCPPRADACKELKRKCLPKLSVGSCPCPEQPELMDVVPLKQLNLKFAPPPRQCPKPVPCPPRADECEWDRLYAKKALPKFEPSNCPCIEPKPLQDFKLCRLKKFKPKDPPPCPTKIVCDPNDRADERCGYKIKQRQLPTLILTAENNHVRAPVLKTTRRKYTTYRRFGGRKDCDCILSEYPGEGSSPKLKRLPKYDKEDVDWEELSRCKHESCRDVERADDNLMPKRRRLRKLNPGKCHQYSDLKKDLKDCDNLPRLPKFEQHDNNWNKDKECRLSDCGKRADDDLEDVKRCLPKLKTGRKSPCIDPHLELKDCDELCRLPKYTKPDSSWNQLCKSVDCENVKRADDALENRKQQLQTLKPGNCPCLDQYKRMRYSKDLERLSRFKKQDINKCKQCRTSSCIRTDDARLKRHHKLPVLKVGYSKRRKRSKRRFEWTQKAQYHTHGVYFMPTSMYSTGNKKCKKLKSAQKPKCPKLTMPGCPPRGDPDCNRPYQFKTCSKQKTPYPSFSECGEIGIPPTCDCKVPDLRLLQPKYPIFDEGVILKAPPPEQGPIDTSLAQECVMKKLNIKYEGKTETCDDFGQTALEYPAKEILQEAIDEAERQACEQGTTLAEMRRKAMEAACCKDKSAPGKKGVCPKPDTDTCGGAEEPRLKSTREVKKRKSMLCGAKDDKKDKCASSKPKRKKVCSSKKSKKKKTKGSTCGGRKRSKSKGKSCSKRKKATKKSGKCKTGKRTTKKKSSSSVTIKDLCKKRKSKSSKKRKSSKRRGSSKGSCKSSSKKRTRSRSGSSGRKAPAECGDSKPKSLIDRILSFFKAKPNCPKPGEWKQKQLIAEAEKAAKAAGLDLCPPDPCKAVRKKSKQSKLPTKKGASKVKHKRGNKRTKTSSKKAKSKGGWFSSKKSKGKASSKKSGSKQKSRSKKGRKSRKRSKSKTKSTKKSKSASCRNRSVDCASELKAKKSGGKCKSKSSKRSKTSCKSTKSKKSVTCGKKRRSKSRKCSSKGKKKSKCSKKSDSKKSDSCKKSEKSKFEQMFPPDMEECRERKGRDRPSMFRPVEGSEKKSCKSKKRKSSKAGCKKSSNSRSMSRSTKSSKSSGSCKIKTDEKKKGKCKTFKVDCPPRAREDCKPQFVFKECKGQEAPYPSFSECRPPFRPLPINECTVAARLSKTLKNKINLTPGKGKKKGGGSSKAYSTLSGITHINSMQLLLSAKFQRYFCTECREYNYEKHLEAIEDKMLNSSKKSSCALQEKLAHCIDERVLQMQSPDDLPKNHFQTLLAKLQNAAKIEESKRSGGNKKYIFSSLKDNACESVKVFKLDPRAGNNLLGNVRLETRCLGISDAVFGNTEEQEMTEAIQNLYNKIMPDMPNLPLEEAERHKTEEITQELEELLAKCKKEEF